MDVNFCIMAHMCKFAQGGDLPKRANDHVIVKMPQNSPSLGLGWYVAI